MTAAMNQTVVRRAAEPEQAEPVRKTADMAPAAASQTDDDDDLASAVEGLVARYTKEGRPRRLAAPSAVNDDPRPKDRMEDAKASLQSATNGRREARHDAATPDAGGQRARGEAPADLPHRQPPHRLAGGDEPAGW